LQGQSAGSRSIAHLLQTNPQNPPFRAAMMLSGAVNAVSPVTDYTNWDTLAAAMNCTQSPGKARLACMKADPGATISE